MRWLVRVWQSLKRWLLWIIKASLLSLFAGVLTWGGLQWWQQWHQSAPSLIQVKLVGHPQHVQEAELVALLQPQLGMSFWQLDLPSIRRLVETHPWVAHAEVSRFWPNTLRVEVTEQVPVARWGERDFVNQFGEIIHPSQPIDMPELIQLSAVNPDATVSLAMLKDILAVINPYGLHVRALHRLADASWRVQLVQGDEWILPKQETLARLKQLLVLYGNIPKQDNQRLRIDLRYRDGFAVKWVPIETASNPDNDTPQIQATPAQ